jgi:hypothetical protein
VVALSYFIVGGTSRRQTGKLGYRLPRDPSKHCAPTSIGQEHPYNTIGGQSFVAMLAMPRSDSSDPLAERAWPNSAGRKTKKTYYRFRGCRQRTQAPFGAPSDKIIPIGRFAGLRFQVGNGANACRTFVPRASGWSWRPAADDQPSCLPQNALDLRIADRRCMTMASVILAYNSGAADQGYRSFRCGGAAQVSG